MRNTVVNLRASRIREVANAGMLARTGGLPLLKFWFGEGDEATPDVVRRAGIEALSRGETFYTHNLGEPALREAIAAYMHALHASESGERGIDADRVAVTSGGVNALMLAMQAVLEPMDEVVVITPVWPNLVEQPKILSAGVTEVPLTAFNGQWSLDMSRLLHAVTPMTKLLIINAPNNPTGWCLARDEQRTILNHCRQTGTWILADEVYERLYYAPAPRSCAPSFLDLAEPNDRVVVAHSFSKTFLMTGWRLGWLVAPSPFIEQVGKLIEFNTSCAPSFVQSAALAALEHEPQITARVVQHMRRCRDTLCDALRVVPRVRLQVPMGGMYAFFEIDGMDDSLAVAKNLVAEAGLGLAPGIAFGDAGQSWLRWCFATRDTQRLLQGVERLDTWMRNL
jgi:aspartate/methionine/tyrosine aminotransferase